MFYVTFIAYTLNSDNTGSEVYLVKILVVKAKILVTLLMSTIEKKKCGDNKKYYLNSGK